MNDKRQTNALLIALICAMVVIGGLLVHMMPQKADPPMVLHEESDRYVTVARDGGIQQYQEYYTKTLSPEQSERTPAAVEPVPHKVIRIIPQKQPTGTPDRRLVRMKKIPATAVSPVVEYVPVVYEDRSVIVIARMLPGNGGW